ncbi:MAG: lytic transglycosylase domain-containing protein [Proteobacteria bacterium]|nr:lytic transglycosylase domain-containing protein [Cystobacterineae bacterium]MCL2259186.1 lytic transglycosylase domain-containing protein [Cystobacterineae bacterium]MCL2314063.1 lytic transglycosylase domain-containing protein [Pseudomonadota bacterium]
MPHFRFYICLLLPAGLALWVCVASAEESKIYKYVEKDGTIVYTNAPRGRDKGKTSAIPKATQTGAVGAQNLAFQSKYEPFEEMVLACAQKYQLPAALLKAVMHAESAFEPSAISPKGALGLMQLMPQTAQQLAVENLLDANANIEAGARYLRMLADLFEGNMVQTLAAYNAGPNALKKYGGQIPPYAETQHYVRKVLALYFVYQYKNTQRKEKPKP